jgi:hypothetical protein
VRRDALLFFVLLPKSSDNNRLDVNEKHSIGSAHGQTVAGRTMDGVSTADRIH